MNSVKKSEDLSDKIKVALDKAIQKPIAEEKARGGYLVISDKKVALKKCLPKIYNRQIKSSIFVRLLLLSVLNWG